MRCSKDDGNPRQMLYVFPSGVAFVASSIKLCRKSAVSVWCRRGSWHTIIAFIRSRKRVIYIHLTVFSSLTGDGVPSRALPCAPWALLWRRRLSGMPVATRSEEYGACFFLINFLECYQNLSIFEINYLCIPMYPSLMASLTKKITNGQISI